MTKNVNKIIFLFPFLIFWVFLHIGCDMIDEYRYKFIIKGNISNLDDLKDYQTYYLQICKISEDGTVFGNVSFEKGDVIDSDLSKIDIRPDGFFKFKENSLVPGKYMIYIQGIKMGAGLSGWLRVKETGNKNTFSISKDQNKNIVIDLGTLIIKKG